MSAASDTCINASMGPWAPFSKGGTIFRKSYKEKKTLNLARSLNMPFRD